MLIIYSDYITGLGVKVMVFHATFNHISVISWPSVVLGEETGVAEEIQQPATCH
jgi:hypothetical protein